MISRGRFVNLLRTPGYSYHDRTKRTEIYRKTGGVHRVFLTLRQNLSESYASSILLQCGLTPSQVQERIRELKA